MAVLFLGAVIARAQGDELLVTNVQAQQRQFTALVDVTYDLETVDDLTVWVSLFLSTDGGASYPHLCQTVSGDWGSGVLPGASRHIVWDAGTEFPAFNSATCRLRVTAYDDENVEDVVTVAPGTFVMGSPSGEPGRMGDEVQHQVTLTHGLYVQTTEVTNRQFMEMAQWAYDHGYVTVPPPYYSILRDNLDGSTTILKFLGSFGYEVLFSNGVFSCENPDHPVKYLNWYGAAAYCDWLSMQQGLPRAYNHATWQCNGGDPYAAVGYRLPTEAEWEYTCRAGSSTAFANGLITYVNCSPLDPNLGLMGWYCGNAGSWTHPVAQKLANAWSLYDMHGNQYEWCNDWFEAYGGAVTNPAGPGAGSVRVIRGGGWIADAGICRSAQRGAILPANMGDHIGFRAVRSLD